MSNMKKQKDALHEYYLIIQGMGLSGSGLVVGGDGEGGGGGGVRI